MSSGSRLLEIQADKVKSNFTDQFTGVPSKGISPLYNSGARAYVRVAGQAFAVAQSLSWNVVADPTEIRTIDTYLPWDQVTGQIAITARLSEFIDPRGAPESQGIFHTLQSFGHQPYVEMQVLDAIGSSLFFARGTFYGISGEISVGRLSQFSVQFKGVMYQHNVYQTFKPYSKLGETLNDLLETGIGAIKDAGGGFL